MLVRLRHSMRVLVETRMIARFGCSVWSKLVPLGGGVRRAGSVGARASLGAIMEGPTKLLSMKWMLG